MATIDWLMILGYFCVLAVVVIATRRRQETSQDFFLGGRSVGWLAIGASIFAANIGSEHVVGLAGQGARTGLSVAHFELHSWVLIMMCWVFLPFYYRSGVQTMPEFLERRFGPRARWILSLVSLSAYVLTKISVTVFAGALFFEVMMPEMHFSMGGVEVSSFWIGAFATVVLAGVYASLGGLLAVVYTDLVQAGLILAGSLSVTYFAMKHLGGSVGGGVLDGWGVLKSTIKSVPGMKEAFSLWHPLSHDTFPWLGLTIASATTGTWYWCTDQFIVQRMLAARNLTNARRGAIWGAVLKLMPIFIFLVPGILGWALHQHHTGGFAIPLDAQGGIDGDKVFPSLVTQLLPVGFRGLVVAGLVAALMSSLASLFNSVSTLFTVDVYKKLRPQSSERRLVLVGRITTVSMTVLGILWVPIMRSLAGGGLYQYLQAVQAFLAPPIVAVFVTGLLWKRMNGRGAVWGLGLGFALGMLKLTLNSFGVVTIPDFYYSGLLLFTSFIIIVIASLSAPAPQPARIESLTFATLGEDFKRENRASWNKMDVIGSAIVIGLVIAIYAYFWTWLD